MDYKKFFEQNKEKMFFAGLLIVSFVAGFGLRLAWAQKTSSYSLNSTPKTAGNQTVGAVGDPDDAVGDSAVSAPSAADPTSNPSWACLFKGKTTKAGKKIYYYQGSLFYNKVKNPVCFQSEIEAKTAGYTRSAH